MKPITINPILKFSLLVIQILILIITSSNALCLLSIIFGLVYLLVKRASFKDLLKALKFGGLLAIFIFGFSLIKYQSLALALVEGRDLLILYCALIILSLVYKVETTNKEMAYVLSIAFSPLAIIGFNQNKLYTLFLIILNQIFTMRNSALRMHKYARFYASDKLSLKAVINLVIPFVNNNLKHNEVLAMGLINNGYNPEKKQIKPYFITNYKPLYAIILVSLIVIEVVAVWYLH